MNASSSLTRIIDAVVSRREGVIPDLVLLVALMTYLIGFLAIHRATNLGFIILFLLALVYAFRHWARIRATMATQGAVFLMVALASLFFVVLTGMLFRGNFAAADLDGPSRYLLAALLLLYFCDKGVRLVPVFSIGAPIALILGLLAAMTNPEAASRWGGRFATSFVDPNTLGSYAVILSFMTLLTMNAPGRVMAWVRPLGYAGIVAGALVATLAASRGGWLAAGPLLLLWVVFRSRYGALPMARQLLLILAVVGIGVMLVSSVAERAGGATDQVRAWLDGSNTETAAGQRLSIYKLAGALIAGKPLTGYGNAGVAAYLALPESATVASPTIKMILIYSGPHNDLLDMLLASGILGAVSFVLLLFGPMVFFWRHRLAADHNVRLASELGVFLTVGVFVCGLTNEMLSLKYLASFYGVTIAALAAQILRATLGPVAPSH